MTIAGRINLLFISAALVLALVLVLELVPRLQPMVLLYMLL